MATIDGRPAQYGISLKHLRELMEHRGREGVNKINELGGVQEICKKLYTSPSEGKYLKKNISINITILRSLHTASCDNFCFDGAGLFIESIEKDQ